jgi:hypothetical protein
MTAGFGSPGRRAKYAANPPVDLAFTHGLNRGSRRTANGLNKSPLSSLNQGEMS